MKRILCLAVVLLLVLSANAFAASFQGTHKEEVPVNVEIMSYAQVTAQKLKVEEDRWWYAWNEVDPLMDLGYFKGEAEVGHLADTNCFIVETNDKVDLVFSGESLKHINHDSKLLTRYIAYQARGVSEMPYPYRFLSKPKQIQPVKRIGYFGEEGKAPSIANGRIVEEILDEVLGWLFPSMEFWPTEDWADAQIAEAQIGEAGIYAYQVFGFASTDAISSQREGQYEGKITLTVSKNN